MIQSVKNSTTTSLTIQTTSLLPISHHLIMILNRTAHSNVKTRCYSNALVVVIAASTTTTTTTMTTAHAH